LSSRPGLDPREIVSPLHAPVCRRIRINIAIIGVGAVGAATALAIALRGRARELVLLDCNRVRAKAVATDMHKCVPVSPLVSIADGDYEELGGARVVIIADGVNEKAGGATERNDPAGRLRLLARTSRCSKTSCRGW
jgi:L-lactate dehydrogenase